MKTLIKIIGLILIVIYFSGCAPVGGGGSAAADAKVDPIAPSPGSPGAPATPSSTVAVTYYSLSRTEAPISGWPTKTYTSIARCLVYATKNYCWDDGMKTLTWVSGGTTYGPFYYSYLGITGTISSYGPCHGGCVADPLTAPSFMTAGLTTNITAAVINQIFSTGAATNESCTLSGSQITCSSFTVAVQ